MRSICYYERERFRRTKWRKKHAAEIHGPSGKRNKQQQRNDGTIPTLESDSNSN